MLKREFAPFKLALMRRRMDMKGGGADGLDGFGRRVVGSKDEDEIRRVFRIARQ